MQKNIILIILYNMTQSKRIGGKAIAEGTYGCVFKPQLICDNKNIRQDGIVSKLGLKKDMEDEMKLITQFSTILATIPNNKNYFIAANTSICNPKKLDSLIDLNDFDNKCAILNEKGIKKQNVNNPNILKNLKIINIPDGGVDLLYFIKNNPLTKATFNKINTSLIDLLNNGITPMNKKNILHLDLKMENILIDTQYKIRIIDWGLSSIINQGKIPKMYSNSWSFQYNCLPSAIILGQKFKLFLKKMLNYIYYSKLIDNKDIQPSDIITRHNIEIILNKYILDIINASGSSKTHYEYFITIFSKIKDENEISIKKFVLDYLTNIVMNYISIDNSRDNISSKNSIIYAINYNNKNNNINTLDTSHYKDDINYIFNSNLYFNEVFRYNVDIWGFLICYLNLLLLNDLFLKNDDNTRKFESKLQGILKKYMLNDAYSVNKINIPELTNALKLLSFKEFKSAIPIRGGYSINNKSNNKSNNKYKKNTRKSTRKHTQKIYTKKNI